MRMLLVVCCLYMLCEAPVVALALARFMVYEFRADGLYSDLFSTTHLTGMVIAMVNSSIHFFVYVTMSSRFSHELKRVCCTRAKTSQSKLDLSLISSKNISIRY